MELLGSSALDEYELTETGDLIDCDDNADENIQLQLPLTAIAVERCSRRTADILLQHKAKDYI